ncbi:hypothetical protein BRI9_1144 [plant metagenome]|uniref:Uncharacterized protein n=1 Tax=plant metagenome TaxID=1297885 RepID=A0A484TF34_9ZZZZ
MLTMRTYEIRITLLGGARRCLSGLFASDWDAIDAAILIYPNLTAAVPRRMK